MFGQFGSVVYALLRIPCDKFCFFRRGFRDLSRSAGVLRRICRSAG